MKKTHKTKPESVFSNIVRRAPQIYRKDISDWTAAKQAATRIEQPRFNRLMELYDYILDDAHLSSQLLLRKSMPLGSEYELFDPASGETDEEASKKLANLPAMRSILNHILDAQFYGYSLIELLPQPDSPDPLAVKLIDRRHVVPDDGIVLVDTSDTAGIPYRELREFGTYILEFSVQGLGLLDKAVPHVLFKRFAQACWSEFCEVCGMPPRVIKTNTQDPELRASYRDMLSEMGTGANGIIDTDDEMIFVDTNASNGEAYESLIRLCSNELSLLVNGAVLGQDTRYGSNSKEQTSAELNSKLIKADFDFVEAVMNTAVLPALVALGFAPANRSFRYRQQEDTAELFEQTMRAAVFFDIEPQWVREKFGIQVTGIRSFQSPSDPSDKSEKTDKPEKSKNHYSPGFDPFV